MQRFKRILIYVSPIALREPNPAVQHAADLAANNDADVKLFCVHDSFWMPDDDKALEDLAAPFLQRDLRVAIEHPWGAAAEEIIREVRKNGHDLVMKTASPEDAKRMAFGTTGVRLMRMCPCPVWIIQPSQTKPFERILAAVDLMENDEVNDGLNVKILQLATSLARLQRAKLRVLHAWSVYREKLQKASIGPDEPGTNAATAATAAETRLTDLLTPFSNSISEEQVHLIQGDAADVIPRFARERQIDIIVMGTVARTGVAGFFIGNTAEKILGQVTCSVLTLKPDAFVSPVGLTR